MLIERTANEVIIRQPASVDTTGTANSKATQGQVDKLAGEVKKGWWKKNSKKE